MTTPGDYTLAGNSKQITVSVGYTDDDNANNSLLIEWDEDGDDWSDPLGSSVLDHAASPYLFTIPDLTNQSSYQIRITIIDSDMADDVRVFTGIKPFNPLIHTSLSTGSSRWAGAGGWGVVDGKYGRFSCQTCHQKDATNVKRVKSALVVTDGDSLDQLPIEVDTGSVVLTSLESGSSDLGDDSRATNTSSANICEACHTQTDYHRYDTTGQPGGTAHYNKSDCIKCHNHKEGFKAGCNGCHSNPPAWNSHPAHLEAGRILEALNCATCHQGSVHLSGDSEIYFDPAETRLSGASYIDADQASRYTEGGGYVATPTYVSCQSVYCHSNGNPLDGATAYRDPTWGGAAMTCSSCHDDAGDDTTLSSNHPKHVGTLYNFDCSKCHATTVSDSSTVSDNTLHVNEAKDVSFATGDYTAGTRACDNLYCHSDGKGGGPNRDVAWSDSTATTCLDCHGDLVDPDPALGSDNYKMTSGTHDILASKKWIRQYTCDHCHFDTADAAGTITSGGKHVNEQKDVVIDPHWNVVGRPDPTYDSDNRNCLNLYCHSDGRDANANVVDIIWETGVSHCDTCHGHQGDCISCHDGSDGGEVITAWPLGKEWMNATPMYENTGPGTSNANSHVRHLQTDFSCDDCHFLTIKTDDGTCDTCHIEGQAPAGSMDENGHIDPVYHVSNKTKDVVFKDGGSYDGDSCSNTACHSGDHDDPRWGGRVKCLTCHRTTGPDVDNYDAFDGTQARINLTEWETSGHGRPAAAGPYPVSGNPPANFPADNPCWHCHDRTVVHEDPANPYRLVNHPQFEKRFERECVYCHMEGTDTECLGCHNAADSIATQLTAIVPPDYAAEDDHSSYVDGATSCLTALCHPDDASQHNTESGTWTSAQKDDIKNQYVMMGVCLQCHDDDDNGRCTSCHTWGGAPEDDPYKIGYDPGTGFIAGSSKASSSHFGHKHWQDYLDTGKWKGGKFCWDCHDPHGDSNIYMIQSKVATETDGTFGKPVTRADVVFTGTTGGSYAKSSGPTYNGICNVCHQNTEHFRADYGDNHRGSRRCTDCHEHGFGGGHASGGDCGSCHQNKPIPNHLGFGLPRDCVKCHDGVIKLRMDIMRQFRGQSHHVQGENVVVENLHCYQCHWEATKFGLIDNTYHEGYNYKTGDSLPNKPSDLVIYGAGERPQAYIIDDPDPANDTAITFDATTIATDRTDIVKLSRHCLSCHNDDNNEHQPFYIEENPADPEIPPRTPRQYNDCKTPGQYAWDRQSIDARYSQKDVTDVTTWGKYSGTNFADKNIQKAFSAHGNAIANEGGWNTTTGEDEGLVSTRASSNPQQNVQCFDCHSSHGSYTTGITSSYKTFDGTYRGGNLKETQAGKGGYSVSYTAQEVTDGVNPMSPAAAQCFDCHETQNAGTKPWGYESTFGATAPIMGYRDSSRFGGGERGTQVRFPYKAGRATMGGHLKASSPLVTPPDAQHQINGSCTPCHDPHGVSPTMGANQAYAVPLLKGTWLTSPYKEDSPQENTLRKSETAGWYKGKTSSNVQLDRKTFGTSGGGTSGPPNQMTETADLFAGLCLRCHPKENLTVKEGDPEPAFRSLERVHETVKGWGSNTEHAFSCSKCHQAHVSGLPRLMRTNCLDTNHRGGVPADGPDPDYYNDTDHYPSMYNIWPDCHESITGTWSEQQWNEVTPW